MHCQIGHDIAASRLFCALYCNKKYSYKQRAIGLNNFINEQTLNFFQKVITFLCEKCVIENALYLFKSKVYSLFQKILI